MLFNKADPDWDKGSVPEGRTKTNVRKIPRPNWRHVCFTNSAMTVNTDTRWCDRQPVRQTRHARKHTKVCSNAGWGWWRAEFSSHIRMVCYLQQFILYRTVFLIHFTKHVNWFNCIIFLSYVSLWTFFIFYILIICFCLPCKFWTTLYLLHLISIYFYIFLLNLPNPTLLFFHLSSTENFQKMKDFHLWVSLAFLEKRGKNDL